LESWQPHPITWISHQKPPCATCLPFFSQGPTQKCVIPAGDTGGDQVCLVCSWGMPRPHSSKSTNAQSSPAPLTVGSFSAALGNWSWVMVDLHPLALHSTNCNLMNLPNSLLYLSSSRKHSKWGQHPAWWLFLYPILLMSCFSTKPDCVISLINPGQCPGLGNPARLLCPTGFSLTFKLSVSVKVLRLWCKKRAERVVGS
jgi:hypothetical protein